MDEPYHDNSSPLLLTADWRKARAVALDLPDPNRDDEARSMWCLTPDTEPFHVWGCWSGALLGSLPEEEPVFVQVNHKWQVLTDNRPSPPESH